MSSDQEGRQDINASPKRSLPARSDISQAHSRHRISSSPTSALLNQVVSVVVDSAATNNKVAIPRANPRHSEPYHRNRAVRACDSCRLRKVKCEGGNKPCKRCADMGLLCVYADIKRVRQIKHMEYMEQKVEIYEKLLQDIILSVDENVVQRIRLAYKECASLQSLNERDHEGDHEPESPAKGLPTITTIKVQDLIHKEQELNENEMEWGE